MSGPIDPIAVLDSQIAELRASGDTGNVENLLEARAAFGALIEAARAGTPEAGDRAVSQGLWFGPQRATRLRAALTLCGVQP